MLNAESASVEKDVQITVNGKPVRIARHTMVSDVLQKAGYKPADHYLVEVKNGKEGKEYRDVEQKLNLHDGQDFLAYYTATTPLS